MSVYYPSFNYLGKNSQTDMGLVVSHLENNDTGETETFLSMDPVYTDNYSGTRRIDYGAKYNSVAVFNITVIKQNGGDFSVHDVRESLKWLTGAQSNSSLDLVFEGKVKYSFTGRFTNASQYKMDSRTIGLVLEFTSISPWAYSAPKKIKQDLNGTETLTINCDTDDLYSYIYMNTKFLNTSGTSIVITNNTIKDTTTVYKLVENEVITLDNNMIIKSDKNTRTFGSDFNFIFPRLKAGVNNFTISGFGTIEFEYIVPIKLGNVAMDINIYSDPICDDSGHITVELLPWSRISETPTTLYGYGISDAYTKREVDVKLSNVAVSSVGWSQITHKPTTLSGFGLENEVNALLSSLSPKVDEDELNAMLAEVLI